MTVSGVEAVKPPRNFAGQFHVRHLIFADRNDVRLVDQNIRRLQHGITKKTVGVQIFFLDVFLLLFVGRDALQPAQRSDHRKQQVQFGMRRHVRLDEHHALCGIEPGREPIQQHFDRVLFQMRGVGIVGGQCVPVGDEEKAVVLVLHADPVFERAHVVAQVQFAGRAHSAQHAFLGRRSCHSEFA